MFISCYVDFVNIVHNNREKTMLSLIKTLLDGASARAEDNLKDRFAIATRRRASPPPSRRSPR